MGGHTPGPWVAHGAYYEHGVKGDVFAKDARDVFDATPICRVVQPLSHRETKRQTAPLDALRAIGRRKEQAPVIEANARLIAAAPDLLSAVESAPIPGRGEEMMAFRDRQDKWLREIASPAIALATQSPIIKGGSDAF